MATNWHNHKSTCTFGLSLSHTPRDTCTHILSPSPKTHPKSSRQHDSGRWRSQAKSSKINKKRYIPWLRLRAMLPEFKASSKRVNIVCNLERKRRRKVRANHRNTFRTKPLISLTESETPKWDGIRKIILELFSLQGKCSSEVSHRDRTGAMHPKSTIISSNMWTACLPACLSVGGCVFYASHTYEALATWQWSSWHPPQHQIHTNTRTRSPVIWFTGSTVCMLIKQLSLTIHKQMNAE